MAQGFGGNFELFFDLTPLETEDQASGYQVLPFQLIPDRGPVYVSDFLVEDGHHYDETALTDVTIGADKLPWATRKDGGVGAFVTLGVDQSRTPLAGIVIANGYQSPTQPTLYQKNSRVKKIRIDNPAFLGLSESESDPGSSWSTEVTLADTPQIQIVPFHRSLLSARITILEVYPGTQYQDLCVSFIAAIRAPKGP